MPARIATEELNVGKTYKLIINQKDVSLSHNYASANPAQNALIGKLAIVAKGAGHWWKADFGEEHNFTKIKIKNRSDCCGDRLARTKVMISGKLCGSLPTKTENGRWYEINCHLSGTEVKLVTVQDTWLNFEGIEFFASEKINKLKIDQNDVSLSHEYKSQYPAKNAVNGQLTIVASGIGRWWKASFGEDQDFTKVRIRNRVDCCGERLAKTKVMIAGKLCGSLPDKTENGKWYEINCRLTGREVKLVTVQNTWLQINGIEIFALELGHREIPMSHKVVIDHKDVSQSSTHGNFIASYALDGKFTHTNVGVGQWWKADFGEELDIRKIRIRNRADCCGERLARTKVMVSGKLCGTLPTKTERGKWYVVNCAITGTEVKLVTQQKTILSIQGIEVFATNPNSYPVVIDQDNVTMSSLYSNNQNYSGVVPINGSGKFCITNKGVGQWWKATFPENYDFSKVRIRNRVDCCGERLAKVKVLISGKLCGTMPDKTENGKWYEVHCNIKGSEVKLVTVQNNYLSIQGIELFASNTQQLPVVIELDDVSHSGSKYPHHPAKFAIMDSDTFTHTNKGVGMWWKANFDQEHYFTKIRIKNRKSSGERLAKTKVMISGKLCGTMPDKTENGLWYEVDCAITGNEIKLITVQNTYLSIAQIEAYSRIQARLPDPENPLGYTPFEEEDEVPEETVAPKTATCSNSGIFGFNGKCYNGDSAKKWLTELKMPGNNDFVQDIWDDFVVPLLTKFPTNIAPSGCLGDFTTNTLLTDAAAKDAKCANFPLPANEKMSAVGFSLKNVPCTKPVQVQMCAIFDKCGTFGVSISGGVLSCMTAATGIGAILSPIASAAKYIQFGYSPNRMWESSLELFDVNNSMKKKIVNMRSHIYMGTQFAIPKTGITFNGKDITEIFALKIEGKAYIDFGDKNDLTPSNLKALFKDKSKSAPAKILTILTSAREYSMRVRGSLSLGLAKITKQVLPDLKLMDEMDLNILINLGTGPDGDKGSSGMQPGFHVFIKPPPLDIIGTFVNAIVNSITKILKIGNLPIPKFPRISGIQMGFTIGEKCGFRFQIGKSFSISCVIKTKGGFGISCKLGLDWLSIFSDMGKWIAKMGKKLFDATGKAIMAVGQKLGEFASDIADGAKQIFNDAKELAKKAWEGAKKAVNFMKEKTKKAIQAIKNVHAKAKKAFADAYNAIKNAFANIGKKFDKAIKDLGNAIKNLAKNIGNFFVSLFNKSKYKREKAKKEAQKRAKEAQKAKERAIQEAKNRAEVARIQAQEAKEEEEAENDKRNCIDEENHAHLETWRKDLLYQRAIKNLNDL